MYPLTEALYRTPYHGSFFPSFFFIPFLFSSFSLLVRSGHWFQTSICKEWARYQSKHLRLVIFGVWECLACSAIYIRRAVLHCGSLLCVGVIEPSSIYLQSGLCFFWHDRYLAIWRFGQKIFVISVFAPPPKVNTSLGITSPCDHRSPGRSVNWLPHLCGQQQVAISNEANIFRIP